MKYIKTLLVILGTLLLSCYLPDLYEYLFLHTQRPSFVLYSEVAQTFVQTRMENEKLLRETVDGKRQFTENEFDSILPTFYVRQLAADGKLPDTLLGKAISMPLIRNTNFTHRFDPTGLNRKPPHAYQLLESAPARVGLSPAEDLFVFRGKDILFFNSKTHDIDEAKSKLFQKAFDRVQITGNIVRSVGDGNARKEYDEGYLLLDEAGHLFHFKQVKGRPYLVQIKTDKLPSPILHMDLCGFADREKLAYVQTTDGALYMLSNHAYKFLKLDLPPIDHRHDEWMAIGNMFYTTYHIARGSQVDFVAVETETGRRVADYTEIFPASISEKTEAILFPFRLTFTNDADPQVYPRWEWGSPYSLLVALLCVIIYVIWRGRHLGRKRIAAHVLFIFIAGIYGWITLMLLSSKPSYKSTLIHHHKETR